jgi:hypothetical protein
MMKSRKMAQAGHEKRTRQTRNVYNILIEKPEGMRQLERPCNRWEDNFQTGHDEVGRDGMDWIYVAQDTVQ